MEGPTVNRYWLGFTQFVVESIFRNLFPATTPEEEKMASSP